MIIEPLLLVGESLQTISPSLIAQAAASLAGGSAVVVTQEWQAAARLVGAGAIQNAVEHFDCDFMASDSSIAWAYAKFRVRIGLATVAAVPLSIRTRLHADARMSSWRESCDSFLEELQPLLLQLFPTEDVGAHVLKLQQELAEQET